jgi:hypothetical protein
MGDLLFPKTPAPHAPDDSAALPGETQKAVDTLYGGNHRMRRWASFAGPSNRARTNCTSGVTADPKALGDLFTGIARDTEGKLSAAHAYRFVSEGETITVRDDDDQYSCGGTATLSSGLVERAKVAAPRREQP